jgi:hypothetical protein
MADAFFGSRLFTLEQVLDKASFLLASKIEVTTRVPADGQKLERAEKNPRMKVGPVRKLRPAKDSTTPHLPDDRLSRSLSARVSSTRNLARAVGRAASQANRSICTSAAFAEAACIPSLMRCRTTGSAIRSFLLTNLNATRPQRFRDASF